MSCIAVVNRDTPKKENKSSKKSHAPQPGNSRHMLDSFLFFSRPPPPPTDKLSLETCRVSDKKRGQMWNRKAARVCVCVRVTFQLRSLSENSVGWSTNKGGKCELQPAQQPSLTITNITSLIIFNIYIDVHKIHSKNEILSPPPPPPGFLMQLSPPVHSKPTQKKGIICVNWYQ